MKTRRLAPVRRRAKLLCVMALALAMLAGAGAQAGVAAAPAVHPPAVTITSPAPLTFVKGDVASVRVTTAASVGGLVARVGKVDVSRAFRRTGKGVWTASLSRSAHQLALGPNTLTVRAAVQGAPSSKLIFLVGSRDPALVTFRSIPKRAGTPLAFTIAAPRSDYRAFQVVLNSHDITADFAGQTTGRLSTRIGADDGLRSGTNRIRVYVETNENRFLETTKTFSIAAGPLAAAGADRSIRVGEPVTLGGTALTTDRSARLSYAWMPSSASLKVTRPAAAHPSLVANRAGRYTVTVKVTQHGGAHDGAVSTDRVMLNAAPSLPPVGTPVSVGDSITANGVTYSLNPGDSLLAVVLDQVTLQPLGLTQNSWSTAQAPTLLTQLQAAVSTSSSEQGHVIVLLSSPLGQALPSAFNAVVTTAGGTAPVRGRGIALVGYPLSPAASVDYQPPGPGPYSLIQGYLQETGYAPNVAPDLFYRFVANSYPAYSTSSASTATTNTMTIAGQKYSAALPSCATGGYQLEVIAADTGNPISATTVGTAGCGVADGQGVSGLTAAVSGPLVAYAFGAGPPVLEFLQSIGNPRAGSAAAATSWLNLANQIEGIGGSAQGFYAGSGASTADTDHSYALVGSFPSPGPGRDPEAVSALTGTPGVLNGALHRSSGWNYEPGYTQLPGVSLDNLPQIATEPLQSWPLSTNVPDGKGNGYYLNAQNYVATVLEQKLSLGTPGVPFTGCGPSLPGIRQYYCTLNFVTGTTAAMAQADLTGIPYVAGSAFSSQDLTDVTGQLSTEFTDIGLIRQDFKDLQAIYQTSGSTSQTNVGTAANSILKQIDGSGSFDGNPLGIAATLIQGLGTGASIVSAATGIGTVLFLAADVGADLNSSEPLVNEIKADASNIGSALNAYFANVNSTMVTEQYILDTDWGKLSSAVGSLGSALSILTGPGNALLTAAVTGSVSSWATGELLPTAFKLVTLNPGSLNPSVSSDPTTYTCSWQPPIGRQVKYQPYAAYTSGYPGWFTAPVASGSAVASRPVLLVSKDKDNPTDDGLSNETPDPLPSLISTLFASPSLQGYGQTQPSYLINTFGTGYDAISC